MNVAELLLEFSKRPDGTLEVFCGKGTPLIYINNRGSSRHLDELDWLECLRV